MDKVDGKLPMMKNSLIHQSQLRLFLCGWLTTGIDL